MQRRTVGIDLAISAQQVAQIYDDGRPVGKPFRFRLNAADLIWPSVLPSRPPRWATGSCF